MTPQIQRWDRSRPLLPRPRAHVALCSMLGIGSAPVSSRWKTSSRFRQWGSRHAGAPRSSTCHARYRELFGSSGSGSCPTQLGAAVAAKFLESASGFDVMNAAQDLRLHLRRRCSRKRFLRVSGRLAGTPRSRTTSSCSTTPTTSSSRRLAMAL